MEARTAPRTVVDLECTLSRRRGGPVVGRTQDLAESGARVIVDRPLSIDEELAFAIACPDGHADGRCRVVRQAGLNVYALRFVALADAAPARLRGALSLTQ